MRGGAVVAVALILLVGLGGCSEVAGVTANAALKVHHSGSAEELEAAIARHFAAEPELKGVKVSVAVSNTLDNGFATRYSVLLAGTVAAADAKPRAAQVVRDTIGGDPAAIAILDRSRVVVPPAP